MSEANLGKQIDKLAKLREDKAALDKKVKDVGLKIDELKAGILEALVASGMEKASSKTLTMRIKQEEVCVVEDWEAFYAFIKRNNHFHLLQKRVSNPAWREIRELMAAKKKDVPGTKPFLKVDLGITTLK